MEKHIRDKKGLLIKQGHIIQVGEDEKDLRLVMWIFHFGGWCAMKASQIQKEKATVYSSSEWLEGCQIIGNFDDNYDLIAQSEDEYDIKKLNKDGLIALAKEKGIDPSGTKAELIAKLEEVEE